MSWGAAIGGLLSALAASGAFGGGGDDATTTTTTNNQPSGWQSILGYDSNLFNTDDAASWMQSIQNPAVSAWAGMMNELGGIYTPQLVQGDGSATGTVTDNSGQSWDLNNFNVVPSYNQNSAFPGLQTVSGYTLYDASGNPVDPSIATVQPQYDSTGNYIVGYDILSADGTNLTQQAGANANDWYWTETPAEQESAYQQNLMDTLLGSTEQIGQQYLADTGAATDAYTQGMQGLTNPAYNISVGGQDLGIVPRRNSMVADMLSNIYGADMTQAGLAQSTNAGLADMIYNLGQSQSPVQQQLGTFNQLWPYMYSLLSLQFGLPSSTATDTATYNPSAQETLGNYAQVGSSIADLWNAVNSESYQTNTQDTGGYDDTLYDWAYEGSYM